MPIYAYKCESCGHAKDVLQKMSDAPLTVCPSCGADAFRKQLTAAGFQLKGSGWYATDFRGGSSSGANATSADGGSGESAPASAEASSAKTENKGKSEAASGSASSAAASAGGCGSSCGCH
ncbi:FmdB family zinc ribbon protein [Hydrogenophaga sp. 5NK40-0174]|uniref:FmdB family zinc ribbon protein n=1 Tax=Hydrogenophaga sp. 5NK40-0174 TaxID=3127649 RepID=UPI003103A1A5